jgi:glucosyl-3-phosphoglycerate phosphatase
VILIRHGQTEFNRVFSATRCDPGIRDPDLTAHGRRQASAVACALQRVHLSRLITSPYTRALATAEIIAAHLNLPVTVDTLVAERFCFTCDIGSPLAELRTRWPAVAFDHLRGPWWPQAEETAEMICLRSRLFRRQILSEACRETAVVTHWGFIRALTGLTVANGTILRIDPARPNHQPEMVFMADPG